MRLPLLLILASLALVCASESVPLLPGNAEFFKRVDSMCAMAMDEASAIEKSITPYEDGSGPGIMAKELPAISRRNDARTELWGIVRRRDELKAALTLPDNYPERIQRASAVLAEIAEVRWKRAATFAK